MPIIDEFDANKGSEIPWYNKLDGGNKFSLSNLKCSKFGRNIITYLLKSLEKVGIVKKGTSIVQNFLSDTADHLVEGGKLGIFTPSYFFL